MKRYTQDYIRKVMKFKDKRIELTENQRSFLERAYQELQDRITYIYYQRMYGTRIPHQESTWGESLRLCTKSSTLHNIISLNSYDLNDRTLLLRLRNYHLRRL
jgi:hypothetical protein